MCKQHVNASWFKFETIYSVNHACAAWSLWIKKFFDKGENHIEETKEKEEIEAAKPKAVTKILTASEYQKIQK